ncbi:MAG TPA: chemotaxis protein CheW [Xanthomonadaceae bacterium]|jgi:chemotaxis-related protein WspB|nr:chemotaxis protein CheW [Xanthomonadaceae bacterium]
MLFLLFQLGEDRYAIEASKVSAVLPLVVPKAIPGAPSAVAGAFDYRGSPVPLIDLSQLALGRPAQPRHSTRIVVVEYPMDDGDTRPLGLIAEHATEMLVRDPTEFAPSGVRSDGAPYLGPVVPDSRGIVQWVQVDRLLPDAVRDLLFQQAVDS